MTAASSWTCANCGREVGNLEQAYEFGTHIVCRDCHKRLSDEALPSSQLRSGGVSTVSATPPATSTEKTLFQRDGIVVTSTRVIVGPQTFAVQGITSVAKTRLPFRMRAGSVPVGLIIGGVFIALLGVSSSTTAGTVLGLLFLVIGILLVLPSLRPTFAVVLRTASGEVTACESTDKDLLSGVADAINQAIVLRG